MSERVEITKEMHAVIRQSVIAVEMACLALNRAPAPLLKLLDPMPRIYGEPCRGPIWAARDTLEAAHAALQAAFNAVSALHDPAVWDNWNER